MAKEIDLKDFAVEMHFRSADFLAQSLNVVAKIEVGTFYWDKVDNLILMANINIDVLMNVQTILKSKKVAIQNQASTSQAKQSNTEDHSPRKRSMNEKSNSPTMDAICGINSAVIKFEAGVQCEMLMGKLKDDEDMIKSLLCLTEISLQRLNDAKKRLESVKQQQIDQIIDFDEGP